MSDIPGHLDIRPDDFPAQMMALGKVTAVYAKDHPQNITGKITTYQVEVMLQRPALVSIPSGQMTAQGQFGGSGCEYEAPFLVGQMVSVGFYEGDSNRSVILGAFADIDGTQVAQAEAEHPHFRRHWQGAKFEVDKNGAPFVQLPSGQQLEVRNSSGDVLLVVKEDGSIQLGGTAGLDRLLQRDFVAALKGLFSAVTIVPGDGGAALKTAMTTGLNDTLANANSTTQTEAK